MNLTMTSSPVWLMQAQVLHMLQQAILYASPISG